MRVLTKIMFKTINSKRLKCSGINLSCKTITFYKENPFSRKALQRALKKCDKRACQR